MKRRSLVAGAVAATLVASCLGRAPASAARDVSQPRASAQRFLDEYVTDEGRVARRDQGDDTVSEGQAYALLLAAALGHHERFARVWEWTSANLQRPDGLLAWHWSDGQVVDPEPAADADLDAARALLLAADRFGDPGYQAEGVRIGLGVLTLETVGTDAGHVLVAGPWARTPPVTVNPSYIAPRSYTALDAAAGDTRWASLHQTGLDQLRTLTQGGLPPDWAYLEPTGVRAAPSPSDGDTPNGAGRTGFGLDAARVPIRLAEDCDPAVRAVAAKLWPRLRTRDARHPVELVAGAAAADAAGDRTRRDTLLDAAERRERAQPSY
ncbi:MAG: glycosyl hydrolase family 8, partial [Acidimicrobiia bacterium]